MSPLMKKMSRIGDFTRPQSCRAMTVCQTESNKLDKTVLPVSTASPVALLYDDLTQEVHDSLVSSCLLSKTIACLSKHKARPRSSCKEKAANAYNPDYITASSFFLGGGDNQWPPKKTQRHPKRIIFLFKITSMFGKIARSVQS